MNIRQAAAVQEFTDAFLVGLRRLFPAKEARLIGSYALNLLLVVFGLTMLLDDLQRLDGQVAIGWIKAHVFFRLAVVTGAGWLIRRALLGVTGPRDMTLFLALGVLYACEGVLFNGDYYFAFVQVMLGYSWITQTKGGLSAVALVIAGMAFSCCAAVAGLLGVDPSALSGSYILIATAVVLVCALGSTAVRSSWQRAHEARVHDQIQHEHRLADLGNHLSLISEEYKDLFDSLKIDLYELRRGKGLPEESGFYVERSLKTLERLLTMQHFVTELGGPDAHRMRDISGHHLLTFIRTLLGDLRSRGDVHIHVTGDEGRAYYCMPSALAFALLHLVTARSKVLASSSQSAGEKYRATIRIFAQDDDMVVEVEDNAGAPLKESVGFEQVWTLDQDEMASGLGDQLRMHRYVALQHGYTAFARSNPTAKIVIPQILHQPRPQAQG